VGIAMTQLIIVVPVYNKASQLKTAFANLFETLDSAGFQIQYILVDDGSIDFSRSICSEIARNFNGVEVLIHESNLGKGAALRTGFMAALEKNPDLVAYIDADKDIDPICLRRMLTADTKTEGIRIGSKRHPLSQLRYPYARKILSRIFQLITRVYLKTNCKDSQTGVKVFTSKCLREIIELSNLNSFSFDLELMAIASTKGYGIEEFPVQINFHFESSVGVKNSFNALKDIYSIRRNIKSLKGH
jgi:glycosyltransferase involved in cell wall biosynthesis